MAAKYKPILILFEIMEWSLLHNSVWVMESEHYKELEEVNRPECILTYFYKISILNHKLPICRRLQQICLKYNINMLFNRLVY